MIIDKSRILDFARFTSGMQSAARGMGRLSHEGVETSFCTAWMVTPNLIVAPDFALKRNINGPEGRYFFYLESEAGKIKRMKAYVLYPSILSQDPNPDDAKASLLRLKRPMKGTPLPLEMRSLQEVDQLYVLHYPAGFKALQISFGRRSEMGGIRFQYDADTQPGSGGAPVLDIYGSVIGMHIGRTKDLNTALKLDNMLKYWRTLPEWKEIAALHRLALLNDPEDDVSDPLLPGWLTTSFGNNMALKIGPVTGRGIPTTAPDLLDSPGIGAASPGGDADSFLTREALLWTSHPAEMTEEQKGQLRPLVVNANAPIWSLRTDERLKIIRQAGSWQALKTARGKGGPDHAGQKVIDRILAGGQFKIEEIGDPDLPYWLQIVRWFNDLIPDLPAPADINREMAKRRTRGKLSLLAGKDFKGREEELNKLTKWYGSPSPGAMAISGIGGIGKSSLVSRFVLELSKETLIWWLDFDRADIAPDHALSMLSVLAQQADIQLDGIEQPAPTITDWKEVAAKLGSEVAGKIGKRLYPLLILDGFEVAQQVRRYNELWPVLEALMNKLPLRVVVSGRAPVQNLQLAGRPSSSLVLEGMDPQSATEWLRLHGIDDPQVVEKVLKMSRGIPLILKLAARLVEAGGDIQSLPASLPAEIQDGFLYQRILDRVIDPMLQSVAKDVLVVRRLSREMLQQVFYDRLPKDVPAETVFSSLMNEMGLVVEEEGRSSGIALAAGNEPDELRIRSEVRLATLKLLEQDDALRVAEIDRRAADWYGSSPSKDKAAELADTAERVYHYLRLGNTSAAGKIWTEECIPFFVNAVEEMPEGREDAKTWLRTRLRPTSAVFKLGSWEKDAVQRIQDAASRSLQTAIPGILAEQKERTEESPLLIYDAWVLAEAGNIPLARSILETAPMENVDIQRNRRIVQAMLAWYDNDNQAADGFLQYLDLPIGNEFISYFGEQLLVRASRIRMTEDLVKECDLFSQLGKQLDNDWLFSTLRSFLISPDMILPPLGDLFVNYNMSSTSSAITVPFSGNERLAFIRKLENFRAQLTKYRNWEIRYDEPPLGKAMLYYDQPPAWVQEVEMVIEGFLLQYPEQQAILRPALELARQALHRWALVTKDLFLAGTLDFLDTPKVLGMPEDFLSLLLSWFPLSGQDMIIGSKYSDRQTYSVPDFIDFCFKRSPYTTFALAPGARACATALRILDGWPSKDGAIPLIVNWLTEDGMNSQAAGIELFGLINTAYQPLKDLLLYVLGPQPLEVLYYRVLGIPFNKPFT